MASIPATNMFLKSIAAAALASSVAAANPVSIPMTFTWSQPVDCERTIGWEVLSAPITTRKPEPSLAQAQSDAVIPNDGQVHCELSTTSDVVIQAFGNRRYWLKAVGERPTLDSQASNPVDADVPLVMYWPPKCNRLVVARHDEEDRVPRIQWQPKDCEEK